MPIGAAFGFVEFAAQCEAGGVNAAMLEFSVNRSAWLIAPAATSSYRAKPGKMGRPAASAEVHV